MPTVDDQINLQTRVKVHLLLRDEPRHVPGHLEAYRVLGFSLSVQLFCDKQSSCVSVHGEEVYRWLVSSWTSDAVVNLLQFVFA